MLPSLRDAATSSNWRRLYFLRHGGVGRIPRNIFTGMR